METEAMKRQRLTLENRADFTVDSVENVESFSDMEILLKTGFGMLKVSGSGLKLGDLSVENGSVTLTGRIDCLEFSAVREKQSFFKGLFK
ncbi:MAG: YabP/YqfC family sporulation protein [Clostridiales bacterium]|nr:YabP/YqfC family sporulation protein [Clostridiales bacterium]